MQSRAAGRGWNGKSRGTLRNVRLMAEQGKPSAVYVLPIKRFLTVRNADDVPSLSPDMDAAVARLEDLFSDAWQAAGLTPVTVDTVQARNR